MPESNDETKEIGQQEKDIRMSDLDSTESQEPQKNSEAPVIYSPNRRNPRVAQNQDDGAPVPPAGFDKRTLKKNQKPLSFMRAQENSQPHTTNTEKKFVPSANQKLLWLGAGFLAGFLGVLVIFLIGFRRPNNVRIAMMKWAAIGLAIGYAIDIALMTVAGNSFGSGMMPALFPFGSSSSNGIF